MRRRPATAAISNRATSLFLPTKFRLQWSYTRTEHGLARTLKSSTSFFPDIAISTATGETLGMCDFTDGFCGPFLTDPQDNHTYKVRVDINKKSPNVIRIVDPYGAEAGYPKSLRDPSEYITFDVANPNCIMLSDTITTVAHNRRTFGVVLATTQANSLFQEGLSIEEIVSEGIGGTFADSVITIPADQVVGIWSNTKKNVYQETTDVVLDLRAKNRIPWNRHRLKLL